MTSQEAKQWLPLVQALAEGRQLRSIHVGSWRDCDVIEPHLFSPGHYQVKPEPRRWWLNVYSLHAFECEQVARDGLESVCVVEVVEVLK